MQENLLSHLDRVVEEQTALLRPLAVEMSRLEASYGGLVEGLEEALRHMPTRGVTLEPMELQQVWLVCNGLLFLFGRLLLESHPTPPPTPPLRRAALSICRRARRR